MNRDELISMAQTISHGWWLDDEKLEHFAVLVVNHEIYQIGHDHITLNGHLKHLLDHVMEVAAQREREACAKVCEQLEDDGGEWDIQQQCANAIRARGQI